MRGTGAEWRDGRENKVGEIKVLKMLKSGGGGGKKEPLDEVGTVEEWTWVRNGMACVFLWEVGWRALLEPEKGTAVQRSTPSPTTLVFILHLQHRHLAFSNCFSKVFLLRFTNSQWSGCELLPGPFMWLCWKRLFGSRPYLSYWVVTVLWVPPRRSSPRDWTGTALAPC